MQAPTLLVQAERSGLDAAEIDQMLTLRPGTGHVVVPNAGHDIHLDQPQAWTQLLRRYWTPPTRLLAASRAATLSGTATCLRSHPQERRSCR